MAILQLLLRQFLCLWLRFGVGLGILFFFFSTRLETIESSPIKDMSVVGPATEADQITAQMGTASSCVCRWGLQVNTRENRGSILKWKRCPPGWLPSFLRTTSCVLRFPTWLSSLNSSPVAISLHIHRTFEFTSSVTTAIFHCHKTSDYFYGLRLYLHFGGYFTKSLGKMAAF